MLQGTDKTPALITDYKEYHTDSTVKFLVRMSEEKLIQAESAGLHKVFKLQSSLTCNSMVRLHPPDPGGLKDTLEIHKNKPMAWIHLAEYWTTVGPAVVMIVKFFIINHF